MAAAPLRYAERLTVPSTWWALGGAFVVAVWWAFYLATPPVATWAATTVAVVVVGLGLIRYGAVRVVVEDATLWAGRAHLPVSLIGAVEILDPAAVRQTMGVDADARAFVVFRAYCRNAVRIDVADPRDPTPYWLISTRHPERLRRALLGGDVQD